MFFKKKKKKNYWWQCGGIGLFCVLPVEMYQYNGIVAMEKLWWLLKKLKTELHIIQQLNFWIYNKTIKSRDSNFYSYTMFIAGLFTIPQRWRQPKCPPRNERINKMWLIHTMEYYSVSERKEIPTHATTYVNSEDIIC